MDIRRCAHAEVQYDVVLAEESLRLILSMVRRARHG